jgi:cytochrome c oxidase assembly protein subunit 15
MFNNPPCRLPAMSQNKHLFNWLISCALLIYAMIILGGVTRLTHSGLSMVNWEPLMGIIPPLNSEDWHELFLQYQQYPEYKLVNNAISQTEFKSIFYFEYFHRVLGRIVGLAFLIPLIVFWSRGLLTLKFLKRLSVIFLLGAVQGGLGWYMVQSGLIDEPRVSQYRLTAHLGLAVALYGVIVWLATDLYINNLGSNKRVIHPKKSFRTLTAILLFLIYCMILSGGFVAGLRAGLIWNTFPLMGESFVPPGLYEMSPIWRAAFEDMTTVQFNHRILAYLIVSLSAILLIVLLRLKSNSVLKQLIIFLFVMICCQIALGVTTLLQGVPVLVAALHQACAILVFTLALILANFSGQRSILAAS